MSESLAVIRKRHPEVVPVGEGSVALFRLGEQCNNKCPMCSNSGRPEGFFISGGALLNRVDFLANQGFKRAVLTGGEPAIHPAFLKIVDRITERGMVWDINTHGRSFSNPELCRRVVGSGLKRAIVSLHSHRVDVSCLISGTSERGHWETIEGIRNLLAVDVPVLINLVLTRHNVDHLDEFLSYCLDTFGVGCAVKFCFPSTAGKGGEWEGILLRYSQVEKAVRALQVQAARVGQTLCFESFPLCVLGAPGARNISRSGFGETHYLEDIGGRELYSIRFIEAGFSVYPKKCEGCDELDACSGVAPAYLKRFGDQEFSPFTGQ